jgi:phosphate starvation-inducible protein PhoH
MLKPKKVKRTSAAKSASTNLNFVLSRVYPKTDNQKLVFDLYNEGKNLVLYGSAGSGKTFLSLYLGLEDLLNNGRFNKIVILRSAVASRDLGFLPGTEKEKVAVYEAPYRSTINDLFGRDDAYDILKQKKIVEFDSTSFLRGQTYNDCLLFVDEVENMSYQELDTIITRIGDNTRIIFAGDLEQCDFNNRKEISGLPEFLQITDKMEEFEKVEFSIEDCVRSGLVKSYLIAKHQVKKGL